MDGRNREFSVSDVSSTDRGDPKACLFVASLNAAMTDVSLTEAVTSHFRRFGDILNVKVLKDWANRPYAFVQFKNKSESDKALKEAQHTLLNGRHIRIERAHVNRTLFIAKISKNASEDDIIELLSQHGPVESFTLLKDPLTSESKGCGFVKYCYREDAINAFSHFRTNSKWVVEWAGNIDKEVIFEKSSVFVGNLNPEVVTADLLKEKFRKHGDIEDVSFFCKNLPGTESAYAFGFVKYKNEADAQKSVELENNSTWFDRQLRVQPKESDESRSQRQNSSTGRLRKRTGSTASTGIPILFNPVIPNSTAAPQFEGVSKPPAEQELTLPAQSEPNEEILLSGTDENRQREPSFSTDISAPSSHAITFPQHPQIMNYPYYQYPMMFVVPPNLVQYSGAEYGGYSQGFIPVSTVSSPLTNTSRLENQWPLGMQPQAFQQQSPQNFYYFHPTGNEEYITEDMGKLRF